MTKKWFWSLLWMSFLAATLQGQSRDSLLKSISQSPNWSPADKPTVYDEKNIRELAPKRAAAMDRYGFVGATQQNWRGPDGTVRLTLYEMADASAAYGLFTLERNPDQAGYTPISVGSEGFRLSNRSMLW